MKDTVFRVYDYKDRYHQSYSNQLPGAFDWAKACADRVRGRVMRVEVGKGDAEENGTEVYNAINKGE